MLWTAREVVLAREWRYLSYQDEEVLMEFWNRKEEARLGKFEFWHYHS